MKKRLKDLCEKIFRESPFFIEQIDQIFRISLGHIIAHLRKEVKQFFIDLEDNLDNEYTLYINEYHCREKREGVLVTLSYEIQRENDSSIISEETLKGYISEIIGEGFRKIEDIGDLLRESLIEFSKWSRLVGGKKELIIKIQREMKGIHTSFISLKQEIERRKLELKKEGCNDPIPYSKNPFRLNHLVMPDEDLIVFVRSDECPFTKNNRYILKTFLFRVLPKSDEMQLQRLTENLSVKNNLVFKDLYDKEGLDEFLVGYDIQIKKQTLSKLRSLFESVYYKYSESDDIRENIKRNITLSLKKMGDVKEIEFREDSVVIEEDSEENERYRIGGSFEFLDSEIYVSASYKLGHKFFRMDFSAEKRLMERYNYYFKTSKGREELVKKTKAYARVSDKISKEDLDLYFDKLEKEVLNVKRKERTERKKESKKREEKVEKTESMEEQFKEWKEEKKEGEEDEESGEDFWETRISFDILENTKVVIRPVINGLNEEEKRFLTTQGFGIKEDGCFDSLFETREEANKVVNKIKKWYNIQRARL